MFAATTDAGFKPQEASKLQGYSTGALIDPQEQAQLAARGQKSASFLKSFHGLLLIEMPLPPSAPHACSGQGPGGGTEHMNAVASSSNVQAHGEGGGDGSSRSSGGVKLGALLGGLQVEGGLPKLMGMQNVDGGAEDLGKLMAHARNNWHRAMKALI